MAWTKCNHGLWNTPEVLGISATLNIDAIHTGGCCLRLWSWADAEARNGLIRGATPAMADALVRLPGFSKAMIDAGWLKYNKDGLFFPNWERHNSESAKERAMKQARQFRWRHKNDGHVDGKETPKRYGTVSKTTQTRQDKTTQTTTLPEPEAPAKKEGRVYEPNPIWDTLAAMFFPSGVDKSDESRLGLAVKSLAGKHATPDEITNRAAQYKVKYPTMVCTLEALIKHWDICAYQEPGWLKIAREMEGKK